MQLTEKQRTVLEAVASYSVPPTARRVADRLQTPGRRKPLYSYDEVRGQLTALVEKGAVDRPAERPGTWRATEEGLDALGDG